ncbi:MAG TPA: hypothetical protein VNN79_22930, partial [Actinomycetota bacterium]|nr:hypothetical protein [Actinomycetota bacterium]
MRDVIDPYSVPPTYLNRARNIYLPEIGSGVGAYARPGWRLTNQSTQLSGGDAGHYGQGIVTARTADGTAYNFFVAGGRLYRSNAAIDTYTDVTPGGVTIDAVSQTFLTPYSNRMIVNDQVNVPWVADVLGGAVTGTKIQYNNAFAGGGVGNWRAYGPAVIYEDSAFFIVRVRDGEGGDIGT